MTKKIAWVLALAVVVLAGVVRYQDIVMANQRATIRGFVDSCTYSGQPAPRVHVREQ